MARQRVLCLHALLLTIQATGCSRPLEPGAAQAGPGFREIAEASGIRFQYQNDESARRRFVETTGGGCAFLDADNDGWLDVFAIQGGPAPGGKPRSRPPHGFFRNRRDGTFLDETKARGLDADIGYGQGVAAADFDNDGWCDLLLTAYGGAYLFRNDRGTFRDVSKRMGLGSDPPDDPHWYTSAAWGDYDRDGFLDLFLCRYVSWFPDTESPCADSRGQPMYCPPGNYSGDTSLLLRNIRGQRFENVSRRAGLETMKGKALGVVWLDIEGDGSPELFVASDMSPNWLLKRESGGGWRDIAHVLGVAVGPSGLPLSGMGVAAGDFDGDLREDIIVMNFSRQPRSYYRALAAGGFEWRTVDSGLGNNDQPFLAFGTDTADFDLDGDLDLVAGNGHINPTVDRLSEGVTFRERQQLFLNGGNGRFEDSRAHAGDLQRPRITRGLAVGDFDNDGRADILASGPGQPLALYRNEIPPPGAWIGVRLRGVRSNRDAIGARVLLSEPGRKQLRMVRSGSSYASRSDSRLVFGTEAGKSAVAIRIEWPSGRREMFRDLKTGGYRLLVEGSGEAASD